jgi:6-phosphogluconolactonase
MFGIQSRDGSGGRRRMWLGVAIAIALLGAAAPAQAAPFVYVTNLYDHSVSQYDVGLGGLLGPLSPPTAPAAGTESLRVAVGPDGRSVYVTGAEWDDDRSVGTISQYDVGPDGKLSPKSPATVTTGEETLLSGVAVSPDGKSVYVASPDSAVQIGCVCVLQYDVGAGGELSPKSPAMVASDVAPVAVAVSPDGRNVYATNRQSISQYDVGAGGELTPKDPPTVAVRASLNQVAVSPDGKSVYVTGIVFGPTIGLVLQYDVGPDGKLSPKTPATATTPETVLSGVAVSPDGKSVYVTGAELVNPTTALGIVSQYDVGSGGELSAKSPPTVLAGSEANGVAVSPDGRNVYATNLNDNTVSQYDVGPGGQLSAKSPPTVVAGFAPVGVAVSPVARVPTIIGQCKHGGWKQFGFKSQGRCIRFVKRGSKK